MGQEVILSLRSLIDAGPVWAFLLGRSSSRELRLLFIRQGQRVRYIVWLGICGLGEAVYTYLREFEDVPVCETRRFSSARAIALVTLYIRYIPAIVPLPGETLILLKASRSLTIRSRLRRVWNCPSSRGERGCSKAISGDAYRGDRRPGHLRVIASFVGLSHSEPFVELSAQLATNPISGNVTPPVASW